ncbi:MAG: radical SAM protein [Lachnospiraceae bacterium]|nr:radical SAM protein [Lachnospiraceae bacterium]
MIPNYKYSDRVMKMVGKEHAFLFNVNNCKLVRLPFDVYQIINNICEKRVSTGYVIENCETEEDRIYFNNVCKYLIENEIIRNETDFCEYENLDIEIDLDITNVCNLRCKHCCVSASSADNDLSENDMRNVVDKVVAVNPRTIVISGGEPLMRKDFKDIISRLRKNFRGQLGLMTNATLVNDEMAAFIASSFDNVSVSLDGVDEDSCSKIRGKGVFELSVAGIKRMQRYGLKKISASMVLTKYTIQYKDRFIYLCRKLNIEPCLRALSYVGRAKNNEAELSYEEIIHMCPDDGDVEYEFAFDVPIRTLFRCGAAYRQFQIDSMGNIYPCQALMYKELLLGNVLGVDDLNRYIRQRLFVSRSEYKTLETLFPYNYHGCKKCNKSVFCWTCLEDAFRHYGETPINGMCDCSLEQLTDKLKIV